MAGEKGNKKHANSTSFPNQKNWGNKKNPRVIYRILLAIYENALTDEVVTSWQKAVLQAGYRVTKLDYWCDKIPTFGIFKKEIQQIAIARVDGKALKGDFNPAASIWRMKQLGEKDTQYQNLDHTTKGEKIKREPITVEFINARKKI